MDHALTMLAIVMLDGTGRPVSMNKAAELIFARRDALFVNQAGVHAVRASDQALLTGGLQRAADSGTGDVVALALPRRGGQRDYLMQIRSRPAAEKTRVAARLGLCISILDRNRIVDIEPRVLQQLFGLTSAQARLAQSLATGDRLQLAADAQQIRPSTARVHLTAIYRKTHTQNIAQLVRVLSQLTAASEAIAMTMTFVVVDPAYTSASCARNGDPNPLKLLSAQ